MNYPLFYKFTEMVGGKGFNAQVTGLGRVLMIFEEASWRCRGVEPGQLMAQGTSPGEAFAAFRRMLGDVLQEISEESAGFDQFAARARQFFLDMGQSEASAWEQALEQLRASKVGPEEPFDQLPKWNSAECPPRVEVEQVPAFVQEEQAVALADPMLEAA